MVKNFKVHLSKVIKYESIKDFFFFNFLENGVPPIESSRYTNDNNDENDDDDNDDENEEKILERIHHDLKENMLIEKLVDALQDEPSSSNSLENEVEKRFRPSILTEPIASNFELKYQKGF